MHTVPFCLLLLTGLWPQWPPGWFLALLTWPHLRDSAFAISSVWTPPLRYLHHFFPPSLHLWLWLSATSSKRAFWTFLSKTASSSITLASLEMTGSVSGKPEWIISPPLWSPPIYKLYPGQGLQKSLFNATPLNDEHTAKNHQILGRILHHNIQRPRLIRNKGIKPSFWAHVW